MHHPNFTATHMKTSRAKFAVALHAPPLTALLLLITYRAERAHSTRGTLLRDATQEALLVFPTLVFGPQRPGATSSSVKMEVNARLDPWHRGLLDDLVIRDKAQARARPSSHKSKTARDTRRVVRFIHKHQIAELLTSLVVLASPIPQRIA